MIYNHSFLRFVVSQFKQSLVISKYVLVALDIHLQRFIEYIHIWRSVFKRNFYSHLLTLFIKYAY